MGIKNKIILITDVLKSSFISLVPFYILYSIVILVTQLVGQFSINLSFLNYNDLDDISTLLKGLFPLMINISISYHLVGFYYVSINRLLVIILSFCVYLSVDIMSHGVNLTHYSFPESMVNAILIPIVLSFILSKLIFENRYNQDLKKSLPRNLATTIIHIVPFIVTFFIVNFIFYLLNTTFDIQTTINLVDEGYESLLLFIRTLFSNCMWFFGIHGINFFDGLVNTNILNNFFQDDLTYEQFFNYFIVLGGSGAGICLAIAIFLSSKDRHLTFVGKVALPFVVFNINEILIFGIPIFMNVSLIVPFILVPIVNFFIAHIVLSYTNLITFYDMSIPWTTPAFINIYMATHGNILAVILQALLVVVGTLIYMPFIKRYSKIQSSKLSLEKIANKLDISTDIEAKADIKFQEAQSYIIKSHYKVNKVIELISKHNLLIYYQPKVDIVNKNCNEFEALLRVKDEKGNIKGPDFIIDIENSGLASILDIWVCKEVKKDLEVCNSNNFFPHISINIFPYTLEDKSCIKEIVSIFEGYCVTLEILERRSTLNNKIINNIKYLKEHGFKISLDDVGVGYTNFVVLYELPLDSVKIDRKVIAFSKTKKGLDLYNNICRLCRELNFEIILEGVEDEVELRRLSNKNISKVQGWYFSKAIPFGEIENYSKNFSM